MKKSIKIACIAVLSLTLLSSTCSSDDDNNVMVDNSAEIQTIVNLAESGAWQITYFFDDPTDETNHFSGYQFLFNSNGTITASNSTSTVTGTWSVTDDSSSDDSSSDDDIDFNISFASPADFQELSDDWDILSRSNSKIELIDVSGGNGGTDYLTFEKL